MTYLDVKDISLDDVASSKYNLAIFACGYEERSIFFPGMFEGLCEKVIVFGFAGSDDHDYQLNSDFYAHASRYKVAPTNVDYIDSDRIFGHLLDALKDAKKEEDGEYRVLVDYSSMPRFWYSEILNFVKNFDFGMAVSCDFVYSVGEHYGGTAPKQLSEPIVLPGCAAVSTYSKETIGIFSLGFNEGGPVCLHRKVEPDKTFSLVARPGALEDYTERAMQHNKFFLENFSSRTIYAPIHSVDQTYSILREMFYPYLGNAGVVMVPFGPKPHALASILAAMNYPEISCLYSSMGGSGGAVKPTAELVICRVTKLVVSPYLS